MSENVVWGEKRLVTGSGLPETKNPSFFRCQSVLMLFVYVRDVSWVLLGCYWDCTVHLETVTSGFRFFLTPFCYDFDK